MELRLQPVSLANASAVQSRTTSARRSRTGSKRPEAGSHKPVDGGLSGASGFGIDRGDVSVVTVGMVLSMAGAA